MSSDPYPLEAAQLLSVGRTRIYDLMRTGEIPSVRIGGSRRIPLEAVRNYLESLPITY